MEAMWKLDRIVLDRVLDLVDCRNFVGDHRFVEDQVVVVVWRWKSVVGGKIAEERCWDNLEKVEVDNYQIDLNHRRFEEVVVMVVVDSLVADLDFRIVHLVVVVDCPRRKFVEKRSEVGILVDLEVEVRNQLVVDSRVVDNHQVEVRNY